MLLVPRIIERHPPPILFNLFDGLLLRWRLRLTNAILLFFLLVFELDLGIDGLEKLTE